MRQIDMRKEWLPGVPDSLTVPCGICHHIPRFDYKLKNAGWNMLAPEEHRTGVICLPCLNKIAKEKNVKLADYLEEVFFCDGLGETIDLIPVVAYFYDPDRNNGEESTKPELPEKPPLKPVTIPIGDSLDRKKGDE